ncbi:MAG: DUF2207 domain-containing protein [Eubacteriaceae bacterium]|nr:DUF2207 domain-containing protein [Eubacteriaceae bacterium]
MKAGFIKKSLLCLLLAILIISSSALCVSAADRTLTITSDKLNVVVKTDASIAVTESITIVFDGHWNGFSITLPGRAGSVIKNVKVSENGKTYTYNPGTDYGPPGTYLTKKEGNGLLVDWSINATNETRTFIVNYEITNVVKIYNDTADLYWKFIGNEDNELSINSVTINMTLPANAKNYVQGEDIKFWTHVPTVINGEASFSGANSIIWQASPLPAKTYLESRVIMPTALFSSAPSSAYTNKNMLTEILKEEQSLADKTNLERKLQKIQVYGALGILLATIIAIFLIWNKYGKPHKAEFDGDYYRELPKTYSPAELNFFMNKTKVTSPAFLATLLDLARRKYYKIEEITQMEDRLLFDKEITTYRLTRTEAEGNDVLQPHEKKFMDLLFDDISLDGKSLTLEDIEHYSKKSKTFYNFWNSWTALVQVETRKYNFFDKPGKILKTTTLIGFLMFVLCFFLFTRFTVFAILLFVSSMLLIIIPNTFKRRSKEAEEDFAKWKAFKRFLLHFSQMEKHEIPSLVIWEHYLVYAAALGIAKEVLKQLKLVFTDLSQDGYHFGYGWFYFGHAGIHGIDTFSNSFDNFANNIEHSLRTAASKASSGSGHGGGFSVGGGGGGGGSSFGGR